MNNDNPFGSGGNPYRRNPFIILGVSPETGQAVIEAFAGALENELADGPATVAGLRLEPGDGARAAQQLQDPVLRLAFDLMLRWPELDDDDEERL